MSTRAPSRQEVRRQLRRGDHFACVGGEPLAMKRGIDQPALPLVQFILAGEESVAQQHLGALQGATLVHALVMRDQDFADRLGRGEKKEAQLSHPKLRNRPEFPHHALEKFQRDRAAGL